MQGDTIIIGFSLYRSDYDFYKKLRKDGRIKHRETAIYMRHQFRQFIDSHAHNRVDPEVKRELYGTTLNNEQQHVQVTDKAGLFKTNNNTGEVQQQGEGIC